MFLLVGVVRRPPFCDAMSDPIARVGANVFCVGVCGVCAMLHVDCLSEVAPEHIHRATHLPTQ